MEPPFDLLAHHVLPAACLVVHVFPLEADHVGEEALGEAVLAHDVHGLAAPIRRQLEVTVARDHDESIAFHAGDGLRDRGSGVAETLGDARTQRHDVLLLEIEDGAEVHLRRVDEIRHQKPSLLQPVIKPSGHRPLARLVPCRAS